MKKDFTSSMEEIHEMWEKLFRQDILKTVNPTSMSKFRDAIDNIREHYIELESVVKPDSEYAMDLFAHASDHFLKISLYAIEKAGLKDANIPAAKQDYSDAVTVWLDKGLLYSTGRNKKYLEQKRKENLTQIESAIQKEVERLKTQKSSGCYIATAVYGSYDSPQVMVLRRYRDDKLSKHLLGRLFIRIYYTISPTLVVWFGKKTWFTRFWRRVLDRMIMKM